VIWAGPEAWIWWFLIWPLLSMLAIGLVCGAVLLCWTAVCWVGVGLERLWRWATGWAR